MVNVAPSTSTASLSYAQLKAVWLQAAKGTKYATNMWASLMAAIAEAESTGDPTATNPNDNGGTQTSWGLWQISLGNHEAPSPNWADPVTNAQLAVGKLQSQGLGAWGTYTSGAYKAFLSDKTAPDASNLSGPDVVTTAALTSAATSGSDCLWPGGSRDLGLGLTMPCLISYSNARAMIGVGILAAGAFLALFGVGGLMKAAGVFSAMEQAGGRTAEAAGFIATVTGSPEVGLPLMAGGSEVRKHGAAETARRSAQRSARSDQQRERRNERDYDQVMSRQSDSARGPAVRDSESVPF